MTKFLWDLMAVIGSLCVLSTAMIGIFAFLMVRQANRQAMKKTFEKEDGTW